VSSSPPVEFLPVNGHYFAAPRGISLEDARWIIRVHQEECDHILTAEEWEREQRNKAERRRVAALRARQRPKRYCVDCGAEITHMNGNTKRCVRCKPKREAELRRRADEKRRLRIERRKVASV